MKRALDLVHQLFPFSFAMDHVGRVLACGRSLRKLAPRIRAGDDLLTHLEIVSPVGITEAGELARHHDTLIILSLRGSATRLRGQLLEISGCLMFAGSLWLDDAGALRRLGLTLSDFPLHDPAVDLLQLAQSRDTSLHELRSLATKLERQREHLRTANQRLALVNDVAHVLGRDRAAPAALAAVLARIGELDHVVGVALWHAPLDDEPPRWFDRAPPGAVAAELVTRGDPLLARAWQRRILATTRDTGALPRGPDAAAPPWRDAGLAAPLRDGELVLGVLAIAVSGDAALEQGLIDLAADLANRLAASLAQARWARALVRAKELAERATEAKSAFVANVSHEIRTPLNAVLGLTDLLADTGPTPPQQQLIDALANASRSLAAVIGDVLDFSKIEAGHLELRLAAFEPRLLLLELETTFRPSAERKGLALAFESPAAPPLRVEGDVDRLRQILANLIANAIKFTRRGGVTVRTRASADGPGVVTWHVDVVDSGIGIPPERHGALFTPFTQGDAAIDREFGGTGLGLAISRRIADRMGGQIGFDSTPGVGSRFWVTIPLRAATDQGTATERGRVHLPSTTSQRVLVAEDNHANQLVARGFLERLGFLVDIASDGAAAVRAAAATPYAAILMDCQMPGVDGYQAVRQIRATELPGRRVPIVAVTANATTADRAACAAAGMDAYLAKPLSATALAQVLDEWVSRDEATAPRVVRARADDAPDVLDHAHVAGLRALGGVVVDELTRIFARDAERAIDDIERALGSGLGELAARRAHTLAGSAANLAAVRVAALARTVESRARGGDLGAATSAVAPLRHELGRAVEALRPAATL